MGTDSQVYEFGQNISVFPTSSCHKFLDRYTQANIVNPDKIMEDAPSDQFLHCLLFIKQFSGTSESGQMCLLKF